jgi:hypothetical protein
MNPDDQLAIHDDDRLMAHLARSLDERDPVPPDALAAARSVLQMGRADEALAELVYDSLAAGTGVAMRSDMLLEARSLEFVAGGYRLDVELLDDEGVVLGQLDPADGAQVALETETGPSQTTADDLGRFRFTGARGPLRLRVTVSTGQVILTPWITW